MASTVKQRLDKWNRVGKPRQKEDVRLFCEWLKKSKEQIIVEYYNIEKVQFLEQWKRDYGDYLKKWYDELTHGLELNVLNRKTGKRELVFRKYKHNTARNMVFNVARFLRATCTQIIFETKIAKAVESTKTEHEFTIEQLKHLYTTGDVFERAVLQLAVNVGLRIEDFCDLERETFERAIEAVKEGAETPYTVKVETGKKKIVAYCQITKNTLDTLETYLKTKHKTKWLFTQNGSDNQVTQRVVNRLIERLWKRAYPQHKAEVKNIFFHLFRKYLITIMLKQKIPMTTIKLIVGKTIKTDISTYIQSRNLAEEFNLVLPFVELGNFIAIQPRSLEQQRQRELMLIEMVKTLTDKIEELTGERPQVTIPVKEELPSTEELKDLFNGNGNGKATTSKKLTKSVISKKLENPK